MSVAFIYEEGATKEMFEGWQSTAHSAEWLTSRQRKAMAGIWSWLLEGSSDCVEQSMKPAK